MISRNTVHGTHPPPVKPEINGRRPLAVQRNSNLQQQRPQQAAKIRGLPRKTAPVQVLEVIPNGEGGCCEDLYPEVRGLDRELLIVEHCDVIYKTMLESEKIYRIEPAFLNGSVVTPRMRALLIDWLIQVHQRFHLLPETMHLAIYILDAMVSTGTVGKHDLQLAGVTSLWVACKYEEMYPPECDDFVQIADNAFCRAQMLTMEVQLINAVGFMMNRPSSLLFARMLNAKMGLKAVQYSMTKYFSEISAFEYSLAHVPPSEITAAALCIASHVCEMEIDIDLLCSLVQLRRIELAVCVKSLATSVLKYYAQHKLVALKTKYSSHTNNGVSDMSTRQLKLLEQLTTSH